ncbi:hypothetical protein GCM10010168_10210 [Actinoplanes ianthinogenes]|uniref:Secreted protein n=1 Tax=Actinoplanes ianthinogenes TaxID=122358 RepID=A0ABN6CIW7_9ACTN|nr:hypothetical protein [Actinoplanes ianthinogenes]BCJ44208.1 hypothetical protein Aiant_48650 [Actinoplanes ianthinogenes]GGQ96491.1 hypothetical protein GCM10010168_10210 [Actinoplanes ianthinogenes]
MPDQPQKAQPAESKAAESKAVGSEAESNAEGKATESKAVKADKADEASPSGKKPGKWALDVDVKPDTGEPTRNEGFRFAAFGALLIVVLFAGYGLGRLNNGTPAPAAQTPSAAPTAINENMPHTHGATGAGTTTTAGAAVGGLSLSSDGLTLHPAATTFQAGKPQPLRFTVDATGGAPVTSYAIVHDKPLHLIVLRRDLTGFQHLHPEMAADGTWSVDLTLPAPGVYRMIADFTALVGGRQIATTLGTDLIVAGDYVPVPLPAPERTTTTGGLTVSYAGTPGTQAVQPLLMTVTGGAVEPYLGAYGHLVVMRQGDLAYVHVHPEQQLVDGKVKFWITAPSPGDYRMFFDFQVAGKVHTAAWTLRVS